MHPTEVLFLGKQPPVSLLVCDQYAGTEKIMRKSVVFQQKLGLVFDITFDCEDGAAAGNEAVHAQLVASIIASGLINHHFGRIERASPPVHVLIETHGALADVVAIATLPQVESLSFSILDFVLAHYGAIPSDAMRSPGQFTHSLVTRAKAAISAACHAHSKTASHNVNTEIQDIGVIDDDACCATMEFGYTRMWSIHPLQIRHILNAFSPTQSEVSEATHILLAAQQAAWEPIQHHGNLHDRTSYHYCWAVLK
ncbi:MAG: CoA ester lyase [Glaciimonas sp.]|nr:CoA ester lyase [Glaciimonas sp.]